MFNCEYVLVFYKKKVDYEAQESKYVKEAMTKFQGGDLKQCAKTMNKEAQASHHLKNKNPPELQKHQGKVF